MAIGGDTPGEDAFFSGAIQKASFLYLWVKVYLTRSVLSSRWNQPRDLRCIFPSNEIIHRQYSIATIEG